MVRGFIAINKKKKIALIPVEDSFNVDSENRIFAVADGVTRDPSEFLPDISTLKGKIEFSLKYQRPSSAAIVSRLATGKAPVYLRDFTNKDEKAIRETIKEINLVDIRRYNLSLGINEQTVDYLTKDYAGCVLSIAHVERDLVYLGFLTDCGVAIFDERGNLKFRTENQGPDKHDKYIWQDERLQGMDWKNPKARKIIRRYYRNNPLKPHSFGVLTGEETAMHYVRTTTQEIKPNEHLIVYTDGLEQIIFSGEFSDKLRKRDIKGIEKLCRKKVKTEGTLIHYSNL